MRSLAKDLQSIWFATATRTQVGLDTVYTYGRPIVRRLTVSATAGYPEEFSSGSVPEYDRYITCYDTHFDPPVGTHLWVDVRPEIKRDGALKLESDGVTPTVLPDYVIKRVVFTKTGNVKRFGIAKIRES